MNVNMKLVKDTIANARASAKDKAKNAFENSVRDTIKARDGEVISSVDGVITYGNVNADDVIDEIARRGQGHLEYHQVGIVNHKGRKVMARLLHVDSSLSSKVQEFNYALTSLPVCP